MKILHIATCLEGGAGIGLWRYHRALLAAGVESKILVAEPPQWAGKEVGKIRWQPPRLSQTLARRSPFALGRQARLLRRLETLDRSAGSAADYELFSFPFSDHVPEEHPWVADADVVNVHWACRVLDWPRFFDRVEKPTVLSLHDQHPYLGGFHYRQDAEKNPHLSDLDAEVREIKRKSIRGHRIGVIANSQWNASEALKSGFFEAEVPIETIYYPLDTAVFSPRPREAAKLAFGINPARKVIGFACENVDNRRKGLADLLKALTLLSDDVRAQSTLLTFGRDPSVDLRAEIDLPWVHLGFLNGEIAQVAAYSAMDLFVVPSRAEAFGLTALEAQAVGTAVVATSVGGLAEAVDPSVNAEEMAMSLEDQIATMMNDDTLRSHRAAAGRQLAVERHSPELLGRQMVNFLSKFLG